MGKAPLRFAAEAYQTRSTQLIAMQARNCFVEPSPPDAKTEWPVFGNPGISLFARMGNGPILGMHIMNDSLFVLSGPELWQINYSDVLETAPGTAVPATLIGTTTLGGLVSMADNTTQLVMVDGSAGWIYQPGGINQVTTATQVAGATFVEANILGTITSGDTLLITLDSGAIFHTTATATVGPTDLGIAFADPLPSQLTAGAIIVDPATALAPITAPAFQPASTVRYLDGYFVFNATGTRQFFLSGINDGSQYSALDSATASAGSDQTVAVEVYHEQLLILCERHTEIWWNSGALTFPFQRYDAALIARGLAAPYAICSEDNTVFWMGEDGIFYRLEGFSPKAISTFAMEHQWAQYPQRYLDASCFVLDQEGHKFVVVNFPSGNATWCYDIGGSQRAGKPLWTERESYGTPWV